MLTTIKWLKASLPVFFKVASVLMHGNMYDAPKDSKHLVVCFEPLFEFQVFVPERMSKEVKSNTTGAALEKPVPAVVSMKYTSKGV